MRNTAKRALFVAALGFATALSSGARADTVSGRITYLDLEAHKLMLDNSDLYTVAPGIAPTGLEVGRLVTVEVTKRGDIRLITKVDKYT
jgi:hypothetical protein